MIQRCIALARHTMSTGGHVIRDYFLLLSSSSVFLSSRAIRSTKEQGVKTAGISKGAGVVRVHEAVTPTMNLFLMSARAS